MRKVAIATIYHVANYGTVLQAYATQQLLASLGYESEIINYVPERLSFRRVMFGSNRKSPIRRAASIVIRMPGNIAIRRIFDRFEKENLRFTKTRYKNAQQVRANPPEADVFLTGSDQVWNSQYNGGIDDVYYLNFQPAGTRKVAYAASIGGDDFEAREKGDIKRLLASYNAISVREKSAQEAVSALGIENVRQVLDPVLAIPPERWNRLMSQQRIYDGYLLLYVLGRDRTMLELGKAMARERNLKIVKVGLDWLMSPDVDRNDWFCTPNEFLSYFCHADYVLTNSFHGLALSLTFGKQFSVILPKKFSTRLESLLYQFGLQDRGVTQSADLKRSREYIDYRLVEKSLEQARHASVSWLAAALKSGEQ